MPIYEYRCLKCGAEFELKRSYSQFDEPAPCPECGSDSERLVSGFGSQVGYYVRAPKAPFRQTRNDQPNDST